MSNRQSTRAAALARARRGRTIPQAYRLENYPEEDDFFSNLPSARPIGDSQPIAELISPNEPMRPTHTYTRANYPTGGSTETVVCNQGYPKFEVFDDNPELFVKPQWKVGKIIPPHLVGRQDFLGGYTIGTPALFVSQEKYERNLQHEYGGHNAAVAMSRGHVYDEETDNPSISEVKKRLFDPRYVLHGSQLTIREGNKPEKIYQPVEPYGIDTPAKAKKLYKAQTNPGPLDKAKKALRDLKGKGRRPPPDGGASTSGT